MIHTTPDNEGETAQGTQVKMFESHGCIHVKPLDRAQFHRVGAFAKGNVLIIHSYKASVRGDNKAAVSCAWLCLAFVVSCASRTRADENGLPFRASGLEAYDSGGLIVWSTDGFLRARRSESTWTDTCKVPLQKVNQLIVAGDDIYVVGAADANSRAVLRTNAECVVLDRWRLPAV